MDPVLGDRRPRVRKPVQEPQRPGLRQRIRRAIEPFIEEILLGSLPHLTTEEQDVYRAPFTDPARRTSILTLAQQVPVAGTPTDMSGVLHTLAKGLSDPQLPKLLLAAHPGAVIDDDVRGWIASHVAHLTTVEIGSASHFVPEEQPDALADALLGWLTTTADRNPPR